VEYKAAAIAMDAGVFIKLVGQGELAVRLLLPLPLF